MSEDLWRAARTILERVPAQPPGIKILGRRARALRTRRYVVAGLVLIVAGAGVFFPLRMLSRLGERETDRVGPAAPSTAPPVAEESHSYRPDWFAHVDTEDRVRIEAPRDWVFRNDPEISQWVLFALGSWNVPSYWEGETCGHDSVLSFLPDSAVLLWLDEVHSASLSQDFVSLERPPRLRDLIPGQGQCVPQQQVYQLGFRLNDRYFMLHAAFGERAPASLRTTVDEVLASFRPRLDQGEYAPPKPTRPEVEVGSGTAFGRTWTLSAYVSGDEICWQIVTGSAIACVDPEVVERENRSYFFGLHMNSSSDVSGSESFIHGPVKKDVAGVTVTLDDGRVFSVQTLKSKALPVAFYVVPFDGRSEQVMIVEALDERGNVLEERKLYE